MRYLVTRSVIQVIGTIWMPAVTAAMTYELDAWDLGNARDDDGRLTRESVEGWLMTHSGDFQSVQDWRADIADGETDVVFDWTHPDSEITFNDCCLPDES